MLLTWDAIALPEHACTAVFICTWVFLQGIGRSLQFVNEVWIEDVELVALHDLNSQEWQSSTGRDSSIIVTPYCGVQLPDLRSQLVLLSCTDNTWVTQCLRAFLVVDGLSAC